MNHWYTVDQLAAGRRTDFDRDAAGDVRMHASLLEAGRHVPGDPLRERGRWLTGRRLMTALRPALTVIIDHGRHGVALIERRRADLTDWR